MLPPPPLCVIVCNVPLTLSKVVLFDDDKPGVTVSLTFNEQLQWTAMKRLNVSLSSILFQNKECGGHINEFFIEILAW